MSRTYHVNRDQKNLAWSKDTPPILTIDSGETVTFDTQDGSNSQITRTSTAEDLAKFDVRLADPIFGPVFVRDAEPGDALEIEILDLEVADWGWTAVLPGFGLLASDFPQGLLKIWELPSPKEQNYAVFNKDIRIPMRPFLGVMGVAPGEPGEFSTIPPLETGGNIDCRHLTVGTKLYLPVRTAGALFSCGDGHAAQGDGEVCGSAIETCIKATLKLTVRKNHSWVNSPHYLQPPVKALSGFEDRGNYSAMGVDPNVYEASRKAVRSLIDWLERTKGMSRGDAYMLASVAADLKITEIVDVPNFCVVSSLPLNVFVE